MITKTPCITYLACIVASVTICFTSAQAATIITVNNVVTEFGGNNLGTTTFSNYTVNSAINSPLLVVAVAIEENSVSVSNVSFGGSNLTKATDISASTEGYVTLYYLANPTVDSAAAITVTSGGTDTMGISAFTLSNVNQLNPLGNTDAFSNINNDGGLALDPTTSITSVDSDSLLISALMSGGGSTDYAVTSPGMSFVNEGGGNGGVHMDIGSWEGGALGNTTSLGFTGSTGTRVAIVSAEFIAIPEPSSLILMAVGLFAGVVLIRRRR